MTTELTATDAQKVLVKLRERCEAKASGCIEWMGYTNTGNGGYGQITLVLSSGRRTLSAHRASWLVTRGPIGTGLLVCHRCDNPPCHRYDAENTYVDKTGRRHCRACKRDEYAAAKRRVA